MNGVLLIPCVGPMQSWGTRSRFQIRDTEREPTKSGIVGMLCAALGRDRSESVDDLAALVMSVRVDREGKLSKDFQTAQNVAVASGKSTEDLLSHRHFLSDAAFLVGLEGAFDLLRTLHRALKTPVWPLCLGRKSFIPSDPPYLSDGLYRETTLREALFHRPLMESSHRREGDRIRFVLESRTPTHELRNDQPKSFSLGKRAFGVRYVETQYEGIDVFPSVEEEEDVSDAALS